MTAKYRTIPDAESPLVPRSNTTSLSNLVRHAQPRLISSATRQPLTKLLVAMAVMVLALTLSSSGVNASTTEKSFEFGPGTNLPAGNQDTVTLSVPARTNVKVSGVLNQASGIPVMVVVQVFRPQGGPAAANWTFATIPGTSVPIIFPVEMITGWSSQVGCPSAWQVRVRTQNGAVPAGGVSGSITFDYQKPAVVNLDMVGNAISIERNDFRTKNLSGHDAAFGIANNSLIAGTGEFRIRAKWDAPFGSPFEDGYALKVRLLKPDGSEADTESGRPQNYNGDSKKVDFWYTVTPADTLLTGPWRLRIFNTVGPNNASRKVYNFDIENFAFPGFNSTFEAKCSN